MYCCWCEWFLERRGGVGPVGRLGNFWPVLVGVFRSPMEITRIFEMCIVPNPPQSLVRLVLNTSKAFFHHNGVNAFRLPVKGHPIANVVLGVSQQGNGLACCLFQSRVGGTKIQGKFTRVLLIRDMDGLTLVSVAIPSLLALPVSSL